MRTFPSPAVYFGGRVHTGVSEAFCVEDLIWYRPICGGRNETGVTSDLSINSSSRILLATVSVKDAARLNDLGLLRDAT